ncbi:MAG: PfkB family carbohydrate kinase [Bacillota bacterium]|jgi:sugar/nucleoside kinase (ribokinase family)
MAEILGLGCVSYDMLSVIPEMPAWEAVEYIENYQVQQGGIAATATVAASRLGASVEFIGGIAPGFQGEFLKDNFRKYGVKCDRIRVLEDGTSQFTVVLIHKTTGRRTFVINKGVQDRPELFNEDLDLAGIRFMLFDGYYFDTTLRTAGQARKAGIVSITDLSQRNFHPRMREYLSLIDYPILPEIYVKAYCHMEDPLEAGKRMYHRDNKALIVTCGARGAYLITGEGTDFVPAFPITPVDTTGAGDVFHGAFAFALWKGYGLREAVIFSSAVSALKCTKMGGQSGIPDFDETKEFMIARRPECAAWL